MTLFFAALILFLLAFVGLAAGLLLRRKALRGGCGSGRSDAEECHCRSKSGSCGGADE